MVNSLQAQLLKSGLVDEKKLKQAQRAKKKSARWNFRRSATS